MVGKDLAFEVVAEGLQADTMLVALLDTIVKIREAKDPLETFWQKSLSCLLVNVIHFELALDELQVAADAVKVRDGDHVECDAANLLG